MQDYGKISVIMGIYNCSSTLPEAIESVLAQTYTNWELIMCDDASSDNTYEIALCYKEQYPEKIILVRNDINSRLAFSLNHCLQYATGRFIARMDGDDKSTPDRFKEEITFLVQHPEFNLVGSWMRRFDDNGCADEVKTPEFPDKYILKNGSPFAHATIMTYKYVYDCLGGYTVCDRTKRSQDYDLWFKFYYHNYKGYNIQRSLYYVREDKNSVRRRKFKVRWNGFKTTRWGFKLLKFPKLWVVMAFITMVFKSLVPYKLIDIYRSIQKSQSFQKGK